MQGGHHTAERKKTTQAFQPARSQAEAAWVDVKTPAGGALCFPHGSHPLHCLHCSEEILSGVKYIIRTDMLFEL